MISAFVCLACGLCWATRCRLHVFVVFMMVSSNELLEMFAVRDPCHAISLSHVTRCGFVKKQDSASHSSCAAQLAVLTLIRAWFSQRLGLVALDVILITHKIKLYSTVQIVPHSTVFYLQGYAICRRPHLQGRGLLCGGCVVLAG